MSLPVLALQKGLINLTSGTYPAESVIHCEEDGEIVLTWKDKSPENNFTPTTTNYSMVKGEDRAIYEADLVEIVSGTFTMARQ